jgi:truncated hemoglobin YjbI
MPLYDDIDGRHAVADTVERFYDRVLGHLVATLHHLELPRHTIERIGARLMPAPG